jgi:ribosomal protein S18 acetylase RimI-like enzyme
MITYKTGSIELIDEIESLWEAQRDYHGDVSTYFGDKFYSLKFDARKRSLTEEEKEKFLIIAYDENPIGYCISTVDKKKSAEIFSLYVNPKYRGQKIGEKIMDTSMAWIYEKEPSKIHLSVAIGNESVMKFYEKFGFRPFTVAMEVK